MAMAGRSSEVGEAILDARAHILTIEHRLQLADLTFRDGRTGEAFELLSQTAVIAKNPSDLIALSNRWYSFDDRDAAEAALEDAWNKAWQFRDLLACAEVWLSRGDHEWGLECATVIEKKSKLFDEYLALCQLLATFNETELAERYYKEAENKASSAPRICALVLAGRDLGLAQDGNRSIADAEILAETVEDWFCCGEAWVHCGDHSRALKAVLKGEAMVKSFDERLAGLEANLALGNKERVDAYLAKAEEAAFGFDSRYQCAAAWARVGSLSGVERCLGRAEREASGAQGRRIEIAEHWGRLTGATHASSRINTAISAFKDSGEWLDMAKKCWEAGQVSIATEMLREAVAHRDSINDLFHCAGLWRSFGEVRAAKDCLGLAEEGATSALDLAACAESWHKYDDEGARAQGALEKAETAAILVIDMVFVAEVWGYTFNDVDRRRELLETATAAAADAYEWLECGESWNRLHERERAVSCAIKAESLAIDSDDWELCGHLWNGLDEAERAEKCMATAEAMNESES